MWNDTRMKQILLSFLSLIRPTNTTNRYIETNYVNNLPHIIKRQVGFKRDKILYVRRQRRGEEKYSYWMGVWTIGMR